MELLNAWVQGIIMAVVITTIIEMILPNGNNKKYVKIILGIFVVFNIMAPVVNKLTNNNFEISSIINIDKYAKQFGTYEASTKSSLLEQSNEKNIKEVYVSNLKTDIREKLKEKGFIAKKIEIDLENDDTYKIKKLILELENKKIDDTYIEENKNINEVRKIEMVNIEINDKNDKENEENIKDRTETDNTNESKVTYREKTEMIKYMADTYGINEKNITIY